MAHRASTFILQRFLSCAAVRISLQDCHPALDLSLSTVRRHVVLGLPLFLFISGAHVRAVIQSLSGSCLRMCPRNRHLRLLTSSLNLSMLALSSNSLIANLVLPFNLHYPSQASILKHDEFLSITLVHFPCFTTIQYSWLDQRLV